MLIVCTQDTRIRTSTADPSSGSSAWGDVVELPVGAQVHADQGFAHALAGLTDPLCLSAHGNDTELGDADSRPQDWEWSVDQIGDLLTRVPPGYADPILVHACAEQISNFAARLALALAQRRVLDGVWVYGYNRPVPADASYPPPVGLERRADLQWTQVTF
ncbi:hypothetical protein [Oerskovia flava]|uniref:hypothetical protein n=1 Tax=Oerskovia flava TaxID=2986422 RepID=UPI00223EFDD7|nr:hypothetical protein [Oerskovia sp. JB1-3-2]